MLMIAPVIALKRFYHLRYLNSAPSPLLSGHGHSLNILRPGLVATTQKMFDAAESISETIQMSYGIWPQRVASVPSTITMGTVEVYWSSCYSIVKASFNHRSEMPIFMSGRIQQNRRTVWDHVAGSNAGVDTRIDNTFTDIAASCR